jgi:glycosyltransferase involved in cell wall biosynthesis
MQPLISVIIPCYNAARFLRETIESILVQEYPKVEIIVVDDGSTDESADIARWYSGVCCIRQDNAGVAAARNAGLQHSSGAFVVFLDADDRMLPHALKSNLECLLKEPDCAFAFGDVQGIDIHGAPLPHQSVCPHRQKEHYLSLLYHCYIWTPGAVMYRRSILDVVSGFDERVAAAADLDLYLRITRVYPACYCGTTVLEYRMYQGNMNSNYGIMLAATVAVMRRQRPWVQGNRELEEAFRNGIRFFQVYYGNLLITQLLDHVRSRTNWRMAMRAGLVLARYAPLVAAKRGVRQVPGVRQLMRRS